MPLSDRQICVYKVYIHIAISLVKYQKTNIKVGIFVMHTLNKLMKITFDRHSLNSKAKKKCEKMPPC